MYSKYGICIYIALWKCYTELWQKLWRENNSKIYIRRLHAVQCVHDLHRTKHLKYQTIGPQEKYQMTRRICCLSVFDYFSSRGHRRRMETDTKANVVVSDWGAEFIQFLAALAVCLSRLGRIGWFQPCLPNRPRQNR